MDRVKRRKDTDEQARLSEVLGQFRDEFEESRPQGKAFIRGEVVNADKGEGTAIPASQAQAVDPSKAKELANQIGRRIIMEAKQKKVASAIQSGQPVTNKDGGDSVPLNRPPKPGAKKEQKSRMSNLELFKEELKQIQEQRQERRGLREQLKQKLGNSSEVDRIAPSLDNPYMMSGEYIDDPNTTNLYLSGLPEDIEMQDLYDTFGSFGPLASAKILYPKPDEVRRFPFLSGFIAFMARVDAERAMGTMAGAPIHGANIRVSWAKPVVLPPIPFYVSPALRELAMPDPPSGLPFNARPDPKDLKKFLKAHGEVPKVNDIASLEGDKLEAYNKMLSRAVVRVVIPTERPLLFLIHRVIEFVIREGPMFEAMVMDKERMNPMFRFLFDNHHPTHVYYRWRLYSVLNGEDRSHWRMERFRMFKDGSWWEPPPRSLYGGGMPAQLYHLAFKPNNVKRKRYSKSPPNKRARKDSPDDEERERERGVLTESERDHLEDMLRDLKPEKTAVGDAMVWCVDHADCAKEISEVVYQSLDILETPLHKKIARLYLLSDILANCGQRVRDVFKYRNCLQEHLPNVFTALNKTMEAIESRIKAEKFRQRVMLCFRMWEDNSIYPRDVLIHLQNVFLGLVKSKSEEQKESDDEDVDGVPLRASTPPPRTSSKTGDSDDEDIDGVPLDLPLKPESPKVKEAEAEHWNTSTMSSFSSKWDAIDQEQHEEPKESKDYATKAGGYNYPEDMWKEVKGAEEPTSTTLDNEDSEKDVPKERVMSAAWEEERRRLLREIEVKVVNYQDELEANREKNVDDKLNDYRKSLIAQMEKDLAKFEDGELPYDENKHKKSSKRKKERSRSGSKEKRSRSGERRSRSRDRKRSRSRGRGRSSDKSKKDRSRGRSRSRERRRRDSRERDRHRRDPDRHR